MNKIPNDRAVSVIEAAEHTYHIYSDDDGGVTVVVGCHVSKLTMVEAFVLSRMLHDHALNDHLTC